MNIERFSRDGALLLGGVRAILLQVADPVVAAAVAEHSRFADRPLARLHNTLTFVYATMLGSPAEAAAVARFTSRAHARIPTANDPERQLWVAATLYDTAVRVHSRLYGPVAPSDADALLAGYAVLGTALRVPAESWPKTTAEFAAYWSRATSALEVGPAARQVAHDLFHPNSAPLWLRAVLPLTNLLTASLLDPAVREGYGMRWSPARERRANAAWAVTRALSRLAPRRLREWPSRRYLARLRALLSRAS